MSAAPEMDETRFLNPRPSMLDRTAFLAAYGGIYESSLWVAERVRPEAARGALDMAGPMGAAMRAAVDGADEAARLALLRAHPELAGRAAIAGALTASSTREQSGAGLDRCSREEFDAFQSLNARYNDKFGFPFIIAVKGLTRAGILAAFRARLGNDRATEFAAAIEEVHKIAAFRLAALSEKKDA